MFEPPPVSRRRPLFAVSLAAHAALALALVVPPLLATPAAPELDGAVRIGFPVFMVDAPGSERREDFLRKGKEGSRAGATAARSNNAVPRSLDAATPRSALTQPSEVGALPDPTGGSSDLFTVEDTGERSERGDSVPGGSDGTGSSSGGPGCEGCKVLPADAYGVTPPVALESPALVYPELARRARAEGVVILEAIIGADGSVRDVRVLRGAGPLLDPSAVEVVRRWRYRAARIGERPVAVFLKVVVTYSLRNL
jgi:protein TonB